ncbi:MAG: boxC [Alphaproteobacteria bacterium]|nr:boxC [Alphaproteobacteria bacterium]
MAAPQLADAAAASLIEFATEPSRYRHWKLAIDGVIATLTLDVQEDATLRPGYKLKLNSYDLGVDIELYDAVQRLRFEHPQVAAVIVQSGKDRVFCSGANINMLGLSSHDHKVNFCKFTNETRIGIEDSSENSRQAFVCAINGTAAGGGYELALACDEIILADDGSSSVSLPELPLLAVLPGTGGLTRLVDKRHVRHDHADYFCTISEGMRGKRAVDWRLVDQIVPRSKLEDAARARAQALAQKSDKPKDAKGIALSPLNRRIESDRIAYDYLTIELDRDNRAATFVIQGPKEAPVQDAAAIHAQGVKFWPLAIARELDDAILHLRANEGDIGTWVFRSIGNPDFVEAADRALLANANDWLVREISHYLKRTLKRVDVSSRSLIALVEQGSCFVGTLLELVMAADRSFMLNGAAEGSNLPAASIRLTEMNFGRLPIGNGLTRLQRRLFATPNKVEGMKAEIGRGIEAEEAEELGLVTFIPDDIDWEDEIRLAIEERASFSPDGLTGMEANLRFPGPETMETKIFARLSAWQNWIFQRPNAAGAEGALKLYGSGQKAKFDRRRV